MPYTVSVPRNTDVEVEIEHEQDFFGEMTLKPKDKGPTTRG